MAIIRTNKNGWAISSVWEDIRPSGDLIFLFGDGHDRTTLAHKWDSTISFNTSGNGITNWGVPSQSASITVNRHDWLLYLADETVHVIHFNTSNNNDYNNLDITPLLSMDETRICNHHFYVINSVGDNAIYSSYCQFQSAGQTLVYSVRYNHVGSMDTNFPTKQTTVSSFNFWPIWWNESTGNLIGYSATNASYPYMNGGPGRVRNLLTSAGTTSLTYEYPAHLNNTNDMFIGLAADNRSLWLRNSNNNDYTQTIVKYDDAANTLTTLYTFSASPTAGGTSAGGNRSTSFGQQLFKFPSKVFDNPISSGNKAFYVPYLDVNGFYHPILFTWNKTTDVFERNTNITMSWGVGRVQGDVWAPDTDSATSVNVTYNIQRYWYNETFVASDDEGNSKRYLVFFQTHGNGVQNDNDARRRTIVTFTVDETNLTTLTYHSHVVVPRTIKNTIWLDDARTLLGVFAWDNFYTYKFNPDPTKGWELSANLPYRFEAVGRDSFGRIWAVDPGPYFYGRLHILTPSVPATISVSTAQSSYNYTGTVINSTATVNAFGVAGERLAVNVKLRVEGNSLKIINTESQEVTELAVTTSASEDTIVNIRVVSAGSSSIFASLEI